MLPGCKSRKLIHSKHVVIKSFISLEYASEDYTLYFDKDDFCKIGTVSVVNRWICSRRNFGLARNLIWRIISPNQDDLSYSFQISFPGSRNWVSCHTHSLWLNNAVQCRRLTGGSSITAAAWTHEGTYLIYGFFASIT